jgi:hypothetical protein
VRSEQETSRLLWLGWLLLAMGELRPASSLPPSAEGVRIFEGARLITGDGGTIEDSAFVVANTQFLRVGRRGEVPAPPRALRIDLTGKTVMPDKVDLHGHIGFQHDMDGTMAKEYYTYRQPRRSPAAAGVLRIQRDYRDRRPGGPIGPARRPDQLGRCATAGAGRNHSGRGAIPDGGNRNRLAWIRG